MSAMHRVENSCVSKNEKRSIFQEADTMSEMSMEVLLLYDVRSD